MPRARHHARKHKRAHGGKVDAYAGGSSNVMKEAHERKRGGRVHAHGEGEEVHERHDRKRARGGKVHHGKAEHYKHHERKRGGRVHHHEEEEHEHKHGGAVKRAKGGKVGSNERPLSTAANTSKLAGEGPVNFPSD